MLRGLIHDQASESGLGQINSSRADVIRVPWSRSVFLGAAVERGHHQGGFYFRYGPVSVYRSHQSSRARVMWAGHGCAADGPVCSKIDGERGIDEYARSGDIGLLNVLVGCRVGTA